MTQAIREDHETCKVPWEHVRIPPFSQVALRVLQLASQENVQLNQLSTLIASDPAFSSEVLMIVNSLLYAPRFPINSIVQAIAVMGAGHLQGVCLAVGMRGFLRGAINEPLVRSMWRHSLACATIAEQLGSAGFIDRDAAFSCGIMHDIGRLAIAFLRWKDYAGLIQSRQCTPSEMVALERETFGKDHCEIGGDIVHEWKLPGEFEAIVRHHHDFVKPGACWGMHELIRASCRLAVAAGFPSFPGCQVPPFEVLLEELPQRERRQFFGEVESLQAEIGRKIAAVEAL
ncbi:MAG: HDOD domain-containing protein [Acidobacteriota bacterium]|nr:HDOD domain-containing protein [Acidobacteriota bacterium]